jgi:hypothetical protein
LGTSLAEIKYVTVFFGRLGTLKHLKLTSLKLWQTPAFVRNIWFDIEWSNKIASFCIRKLHVKEISCFVTDIHLPTDDIPPLNLPSITIIATVKYRQYDNQYAVAHFIDHGM